MAVFSQRTVKFSILENIALYFQNRIERLFLCARERKRARKNFRFFPGQIPGPFFKIYISIQITLFFDFFVISIGIDIFRKG